MSKQFSKEFQKKARPSQLVNAIQSRDVNVLIFLDFSFRYDSVHQRYKRLKRLHIMKFYGIE